MPPGAPKAVLHDHLDGGLRIDTLLELAEAAGYSGLPSLDRTELAAAMHQAESGSLVSYLDAFRHTVAVMQTAPAVERIAYEAAIDHHTSGVVYAEIRFGPGLLISEGMSREEAIEAALRGMQRAAGETGIELGLIISALRQADDSLLVANAATRFVGAGVVGFDLAGPEAGYPPELHLPAINHAREHGLGITLHAGEGAGTESIGAALNKCGAQRIGHGVRIIEDCVIRDGAIVDMGLLAQHVHDHRVPLEVAVSSNIHTGIAPDAKDHPFGLLYRAGFNVSINTDNRLMSGIEMDSEVALVADCFDLSFEDLAVITRRTIEAGFGDWDRRRRLLDVVDAAYAEITSNET